VSSQTGCAHCDQGWLLVKHPSSPSLEATVKDFVKGDRSWVVRFDWWAIDGADRQQLREMCAARCVGQTQKTFNVLRDLMRGLVVQCDLEKTEEWKATRIHVAFKRPRFALPQQKRRRR